LIRSAGEGRLESGAGLWQGIRLDDDYRDDDSTDVT
jgi:hypothetical protein